MAGESQEPIGHLFEGKPAAVFDRAYGFGRRACGHEGVQVPALGVGVAFAVYADKDRRALGLSALARSFAKASGIVGAPVARAAPMLSAGQAATVAGVAFGGMLGGSQLQSGQGGIFPSVRHSPQYQVNPVKAFPKRTSAAWIARSSSWRVPSSGATLQALHRITSLVMSYPLARIGLSVLIGLCAGPSRKRLPSPASRK